MGSQSNTIKMKEDDQTQGTGIVKPMDDDILSGRGAGVNLHPGNQFFRSIIQQNKQSYIEGDPGEKKRIIKKIVETVTKHGRFLKQDPKTELWQPITIDEVRKKTGQALRENAPAIKKQRNEIKEKMKLVHQLKAVLPNYLQSRNERESISLRSKSPPQTTSSYSSPLLGANTANLLWTRMNMLQEKQEQLKRKQRELEDEHNELMQYLYQMSAPLTTPAPLNSMEILFKTGNSSCSDSESDHMIYAPTQKRRRIVDPGH